MRQHPVIGERILGAAARAGAGGQTGALRPPALGRRRLSRRAVREAIALGARIVFVCDVCDAESYAGTQSDPCVVRARCEHLTGDAVPRGRRPGASAVVLSLMICRQP